MFVNHQPHIVSYICVCKTKDIKLVKHTGLTARISKKSLIKKVYVEVDTTL